MEPSRDPPLILASGSPRRRQLLWEAGYDFLVIPPSIREPERMGPDVPAHHQAEALSYFKARSVAQQRQAGVVIGADTIVACEGRVWGKPVDIDEARTILTALVGREQQVITGVTLLDAATGGREITHDTTTVFMRQLPEATIEAYLATGAWEGKAGAYGIQDRGDAFIERIAGSFTNVVGLPMELLAGLLTEWGRPPPGRVGGPTAATDREPRPKPPKPDQAREYGRQGGE